MDILLRKQNYIVGRLFPASILVYGIFVKGNILICFLSLRI